MASVEKTLERMRKNPRDWRIEDLKSVADRYGVVYHQGSTSHVTFRHVAAAKVTVPVARPIKPVYVKRFVEMIETIERSRG